MHPALDADALPASCHLVEVSDEAGVEGEVIEGDVPVVDEARPVQHADLVIVEVESQLRLFRSHRIGGACACCRRVAARATGPIRSRAAGW